MVTRARLAGRARAVRLRPDAAQQPALKQLYYGSDIFCLPTYGDCLPMVLSEAGAAGMAVVSTQMAAIPEIVRNNETGLTVPAGDTAAVSEALRRLAASPDLRMRLAERAMAHVSRDYDAEKNSCRLLELLKDQADIARTKAGGRTVRGTAVDDKDPPLPSTIGSISGLAG